MSLRPSRRGLVPPFIAMDVLRAATERARAALDLGRGRDVEYAAGFALAQSGDSSGAQALAEDLAERFPEDTPVQFEYLPTLRALGALSKVPADLPEVCVVGPLLTLFPFHGWIQPGKPPDMPDGRRFLNIYMSQQPCRNNWTDANM